MHESSGWLLDARMARIIAAAWAAVVIVYGLWRSRGDARQDVIRESGPVL